MSDLKYKVIQDAILKQLQFEGTYEEVFYVIDMIRNLNDVGRKDGLLKLEEEALKIANEENIPNGYQYGAWPENVKGWRRMVARGLMLIVDGAFPDDVERILCSYYYSNNYEGIEALLCAMAIYGVLMIQNGEDSMQISEKMCEVLPENIKNEYLKRKTAE